MLVKRPAFHATMTTSILILLFSQVVYIAPLKALVRERMNDWRIRLEKKLGKKVVELTGKNLFITYYSACVGQPSIKPYLTQPYT